MQLKPMRIGNIHLYTDGLTPEEGSLTGVNLVASVAAAARASVVRSGRRRVAVVPEGPYVVPRFRAAG